MKSILIAIICLIIPIIHSCNDRNNTIIYCTNNSDNTKVTIWSNINSPYCNLHKGDKIHIWHDRWINWDGDIVTVDTVVTTD